MEGLSGKENAIFSLMATSTLGGAGVITIEGFSTICGGTFSLDAGSAEGGMINEGFSSCGTATFSLETISF